MELIQINEDIRVYDDWLSQQKDSTKQQDKFIDYNNYLKDKFDQQMKILFFLFGSSREYTLILTKIGFIVEKSLKECVIF